MAVKKVYHIKDEILNNEYEFFGQSGVMFDDIESLFLLDCCQMAQYIIEQCAESNDKDIYSIKEQNLIKTCEEWSNQIAKKVLNSVYENAISDIEDDEELILE